MIGVWLFLPLVAVGMVAVVVAVRSAAREALRLSEELDQFALLRPALVELQRDTDVTRTTLGEVRLDAARRWSRSS